MSEQQDLIDDLIEIQKDWNAVKNPFASMANALSMDPSQRPVYNPADYKFRPRANSDACIACKQGGEARCRACIDICPVDAITITQDSIHIADTCRKCGLCSAVCPTEALTDYHHEPKTMYDQIFAVASTHEKCYITCTRALGRLPEENEVLLPCVGALSAQTWTALLAKFDNLSVYLPLGICDLCRNTTGEKAYVDAICEGEAISQGSCDLEVDEDALLHVKKHSYERREFVDSFVRSTKKAFVYKNPALLSAGLAAEKIKSHAKQISEIEKSIERACGDVTSQKDRRHLTQNRKLILGLLQDRPDLIQRMSFSIPQIDPDRCTFCNACVTQCPVHATDIDEKGHFSVEPSYCVGCGVCVEVCETDALVMVEADPEAMIVVDSEKEERLLREKKNKAEVQRIKKQGMDQIKRGLDLLEKLGLDDENNG